MVESNRKDFRYKREWREWKEQHAHTELKTETEKEDHTEDHTDDWRDRMYFIASMVLFMWSLTDGIPDGEQFIFFALLAITGGMILHIIGGSIRRRHESLIAKLIGYAFILSAYGVLYLTFVHFV